MGTGIISKRINATPLRGKLAWGYTLVFTLLFAFGFSSVYLISERYRQEEFYQRLQDRMTTTYKLLIQVEQIDHDLLQVFDRNTINSLYDEKILLFDSSGNVIYSSIDDAKISYSKNLIKKLMSGETEIKITEGNYELLALQFKNDNQTFYGIAKAYDRFGRSKIAFLRKSLFVVFFVIITLLVAASLWMAKIITAPISRLAKDIEGISPNNISDRIDDVRASDEIGVLTKKFNELLDKVENAFKFQHHFIHHVSHELKTPLSVMMANAEGALADNRPATLQQSLLFQKNYLMEVSHIINAMLDISKTENKLIDISSDHIRVDEILFECIDEISQLNSTVQIDVMFDGAIEMAEKLTIKGNNRMLKMAFVNLLKNAVNYSDKLNPALELNSSGQTLCIKLYNDGGVIADNDRKNLFTHLFRGENSTGKKGFGLGLVLVQRIVKLHNGEIFYTVTHDGRNCFVVYLPVA